MEERLLELIVFQVMGLFGGRFGEFVSHPNTAYQRIARRSIFTAVPSKFAGDELLVEEIVHFRLTHAGSALRTLLHHQREEQDQVVSHLAARQAMRTLHEMLEAGAKRLRVGWLCQLSENCTGHLALRQVPQDLHAQLKKEIRLWLGDERSQGSWEGGFVVFEVFWK